jgi:uncharacterized protein (DUF4415 family)
MEDKMQQTPAQQRRRGAVERYEADRSGPVPPRDEFLRSIELELPEKRTVTIRLDSDVLDWFKGQGKGYQTRINKVLRRYMEAHQNNGGTLSNG